MEEKLIVESLSPMERAVLPKLSQRDDSGEPSGDFLDVEDVSKEAELDKTTALRAVGFLKTKGLVESESSEKKVVILGILGVNYLKKELPERVLLNKLAGTRNSVPSNLGNSDEFPSSSGKKTIPIGEIKNVCGLNDNEAKSALGALKKKGLVEINQGKLSLNAKSEEVTKKMIEELFMEKLPMD